MKRRDFLSYSLSATAAALGVGFYDLKNNVANAAIANRKVFVVFLRGGFDALYAFPSVASESLIAGQRTNMFVTNQYRAFANTPYNGVLKYHRDLDIFASESSFAILTHAGSINSTRSHFEQMDYIEGGDPTKILPIGYLARAVNAQAGVKAAVIGGVVPASLRGGDPMVLSGLSSLSETVVLRNVQTDAIVARSAPNVGMTERLTYLSAKDFVADCPTGDRICNSAQNAAANFGEVNGMSVKGTGAFALAGAVSKTALAPQVITIDVNGWDIHDDAVDRMSGSLGLLTKLNAGLKTLKAELGGSWGNSVVVVMSEFGRTISENGTGGADHGRGGAMIVLGQNVRAPRNARKDWLFGVKDVEGAGPSQAFKVTTDYRNVLASVMSNHLGLNPLDIAGPAVPTGTGSNVIFPGLSYSDPGIF